MSRLEAIEQAIAAKLPPEHRTLAPAIARLVEHELNNAPPTGERVEDLDAPELQTALVALATRIIRVDGATIQVGTPVQVQGNVGVFQQITVKGRSMLNGGGLRT